MLRATVARMLVSCSRVSCCQGFRSQSSLPASFSRLPALGSDCSGLHQQEQRLLAQPGSLWSAVFQGHLGRAQLFSFHTAAAAGSAGPTNGPDTKAQPRTSTAKQSGPGPLQGLNRQRRSSRKTSSKQAAEQQSGDPEGGGATGNSSSSKARAKAEDLSLGAQLLAQPHGDLTNAAAAAAQQQPDQQQPSEQLQLQQEGQQHPTVPDGQQRMGALQQPFVASASAAVQTPVQQPTQQPAKPPPKKQIGPKKGRPTSSSRAAQEAGKPADSSRKKKTNSRQSSSTNGSPLISTGNSSSSSSSSDLSTQSPPPSTPAAAAVAAAVAVEAPSREASLALQNAFIQPAPLLPPSGPVCDAVLGWAEGLEDQPLMDWATVLKDWKAGMAKVKHPFTQQQVDVLALPYYRHGKLVDLRYLHIVDGCLEASWLAAEACEPFMRNTHLQGVHQVVFVGSELDALLLTATQPDWPVIALTQQTPQWYPTDPQQQQQHLLWQQQQVTEDPRRRLVALQDELQRLRQEYELGQQRQAVGAAGPGREQGLAVADAAVSSPTGLQLLLHQLPRQLSGADAEQQQEQDCVAVIALPEGPGLHTLSVALASLLGELHCRQAFWPSKYASPAALYDQRLALALQSKAAAEAAAAASSGEAGDAAAAAATAAVQDLSEVDEHVVFACTALAGLASPPVMHSWSVLAVHFLRDVLQPGHGGVLSCLAEATVWPLTGLERFADRAEELLQYWDQTDVNKMPHSTGWPGLDDYYKVCPGEVTIVTGVPNSGKSEWLDALAVNLAESEGWRFAMCSMEKKPRDHARQLLEKHVRKPLLQADYSRGAPQMSEAELAEAYDWLCNHFYVIAAGDGNMPTLTWVLEKARAAKMQYGIDGLIIDPYNELDPSRASGLKEHEHVNQTMAMLRKFARDYNVAVWLVAHPRQFSNWWTGQRPGLQEISGGANFANKADNGIVVHRDWTRLKELRDRAAAASGKAPSEGGRGKGRGKGGDKGAEGGAVEEVDPLEELKVLVFIEKVRNKGTGSRGESVLYYDKASGRYFDAFAGQEFEDWAESIQGLAQARAQTAQVQQQQQAEHDKHQLEVSAPTDLPSSSGSSPRSVHTSSSSSSSSSSSDDGGSGGNSSGGGSVGVEADPELEALWLQQQQEMQLDLDEYDELQEGQVDEIPWQLE